MTTTINGQLEIDTDRGVIYFHTSDQKWMEKFGSVTVLRICSLPTPVPVTAPMLDITHMFGTSWGGREELNKDLELSLKSRKYVNFLKVNL